MAANLATNPATTRDPWPPLTALSHGARFTGWTRGQRPVPEKVPARREAAVASPVHPNSCETACPFQSLRGVTRRSTKHSTPRAVIPFNPWIAEDRGTRRCRVENRESRPQRLLGVGGVNCGRDIRPRVPAHPQPSLPLMSAKLLNFPCRMDEDGKVFVGLPLRADPCPCPDPLQDTNDDPGACFGCGRWTPETVDRTWRQRARELAGAR